MNTTGKDCTSHLGRILELNANRVTSQYLWPFKEDVTRFDFEVAEEDVHMCAFMVKSIVGADGLATPNEKESQLCARTTPGK